MNEGEPSKYLAFIDMTLQHSQRKTKTFYVVSRVGGDRLGEIKWHGPWRRYVFQPLGPSIYDANCLKDIAKFIDNEMEQRKPC